MIDVDLLAGPPPPVRTRAARRRTSSLRALVRSSVLIEVFAWLFVVAGAAGVLLAVHRSRGGCPTSFGNCPELHPYVWQGVSLLVGSVCCGAIIMIAAGLQSGSADRATR